MLIIRRPLAVLALLLLAAAPARADSLAAFNQSVADAYAPFRIAAAYLRTGAAMPAAMELDAALETWRSDVLPFAEAPPAAFSADAQFAATLDALERTLAQVQEAADAGDPEAGLAPADAFRRQLSALRQRNGLYLFPDCLLDLTDAMDALWAYRHAPPDFDDRGSVAAVAQTVGVLEAAAARCDRLAGPEDRAQDKYGRLMGGLTDSMAPLKESVRDGDMVRFVNVLREQRSLERLLTMEFG